MQNMEIQVKTEIRDDFIELVENWLKENSNTSMQTINLDLFSQICEQLFDDLGMSNIKGFDCNYSVYEDDKEFNNELYEIFLDVIEPEHFNRNRPYYNPN